jgi:acyl-[acyl-carrier-protein]-phospholipid O-acyltransferase/long-chain-fatty-acid--[acyl-carrier-protein] ligase
VSHAKRRPFLLRLLAGAVLKLLRVSVRYRDGTLQTLRARPAIVIANHVSFVDGLIIALASPVPLTFGVDTEYAVKQAATRGGLAALSRIGLGSVVPIAADAPLGVRRLARALEQGHSVMVFPEGRISPDGSPCEKRPGVTWLSDHTNAPVVELRIEGAQHSRLFAKQGARWWPAIELSF